MTIGSDESRSRNTPINPGLRRVYLDKDFKFVREEMLPPKEILSASLTDIVQMPSAENRNARRLRPLNVYSSRAEHLVVLSRRILLENFGAVVFYYEHNNDLYARHHDWGCDLDKLELYPQDPITRIDCPSDVVKIEGKECVVLRKAKGRLKVYLQPR